MSEQKQYKCDVAGCGFSATGATEEEVFQAALEHAFNDHHVKDTPEFRERVLKLIRDEIPAE